MGQPHVIDEQPGDLVPKSEANFADKLGRDVAIATRHAGEIPLPPNYLVVLGETAPTIDAHGIVRGGGITASTPDCEALLTAYVAELSAWNSRFTLILQELRKAPST